MFLTERVMNKLLILPIDRKPLVEKILPYRHSDYFPWGSDLYDHIQVLK